MRALRRSPGYTVLVLATFGIGAGAATAIFSTVNALMFRPLPFPAAYRLVMLWESSVSRGWNRVPVAPANAMDWRAQVPSLEDIAVVREEASSVALTTGNSTVGVSATAVSGNLFGVLGVTPLLGRTFTMDETWAESAPVAVLSHRAWRAHFGGDSGIVGRLIRLEGGVHEVIGVMRPSFDYPMNDADVWTTFRWDAAVRSSGWFRRAHVVRAIARLRDGVPATVASGELASVAARLAVDFPQTNEGVTAGLTPLREFLVGDRRLPMLLLLGAAGLLMLIVCANVAHLAMARSLARRHELAVRSALGASSGRLARLAFMESACLAVLGTGIGLGVAAIGLGLITGLRPAELPPLTFQLDWRVFAFAAGLASASTLLFGLQPALTGARTDVATALEGRHGISTGRNGLVTAHILAALEVALAVVLVVSAGLMVRSVDELRKVESGVAMDNVLTFTVAAPAWKYGENSAKVQLAQRLLERLRSVPGVVEAGVARSIPFMGQGWTSEFTVEGWPADRFGIEVRHRQVTPGYFSVLGVPVRSGTLFGEQTPGSPTLVVVNQAFADAWFPGESPIGRRITYSRTAGEDATWHQVIGVVGNERMELEVEPLPEIIEPLAADPPQQMQVVVRVDGTMQTLVPALRAAVTAVEPEAPVLQLRTLQAVALDALAADRYMIAILGAFAAVALIVAAVGVYGVAAQGTRLRTHEVGIRIALGAGPLEVMRSLMARGMVFMVAGIATGVLATLASGRLIRTQLFRVEPTDPLTLATVSVILLAVALTAVLIPTLRALRVDPVRVLRGE